jgi:ATP-dependent Lhr-like helicase
LFDVTQQYDPNNPLITQAFHEVMTYQLESHRLIEALNRIQNTEIKFAYPDKPSPFSFPIMVDRLRQKLSSETVEDRIRKMQIELEK